nr:MAG TPA: hypothetical protein [Caudoviricetes sp.]
MRRLQFSSNSLHWRVSPPTPRPLDKVYFFEKNFIKTIDIIQL